MKDLPIVVTNQVKQLESQDPQALVAVFDAYGDYLYASATHEGALGYTSAELLDMHLAEVVDPAEHRGAYVLRTISVFYTRPIPFSSRLIAKSGARVPVSGTLRHIRADSGVRYFITCVRAAADAS